MEAHTAFDPTLRVREAINYLGFSRAKLYQLFATGEIQRIKLGPNITAVRLSSLNDYIRRRERAGKGTA